MDTVWIKTRMRRMKIKQKDIAEQMGISEAGLTRKIRNQRPTYLSEAVILARMLELTPDEIKERLIDR